MIIMEMKFSSVLEFVICADLFSTLSAWIWSRFLTFQVSSLFYLLLLYFFNFIIIIWVVYRQCMCRVNLTFHRTVLKPYACFCVEVLMLLHWFSASTLACRLRLLCDHHLNDCGSQLLTKIESFFLTASKSSLFLPLKSLLQVIFTLSVYKDI